MSYVNTIISLSSDEKTFVKTFIEQLTAADSKITCDTDIDEQFSDTKNTPEFTVNFGTNCKIIFTRNGVLSTAAANYKIVVKINDTQYGNVFSIGYSQTALAQTAVAVRVWKFIVAANESSVYIALGSYSNTMPNSASLSFISIAESGFSAATVTTNAAAVSSNFYGTNTGNIGNTYNFANRLLYNADDGKTEIIKNKALLNDTNKVMEISGLYDCSNMPVYTYVEIDGSKYFTLSANTLMPVD
ncbi:MAG: hypothetical protein PUG48_01890 [Clostridia bacterium]|nr:hypothetical protein [Clostridia bacterium]